MMETFEEFAAKWREMERQPKNPDIKLTCACGKHDTRYVSLTDDELREMYNIIYNQ